MRAGVEVRLISNPEEGFLDLIVFGLNVAEVKLKGREALFQRVVICWDREGGEGWGLRVEGCTQRVNKAA